MPTKLSERMRRYLPLVSGEWCKAVSLGGGEPLLYFDTVKEVFALAADDVHKRIMSNCSLLTQEIVDYINDNAIELQLSHDGEATEFLRGRDVLKEKSLLDLLKQVEMLTVFGVCTNRNEDIMANYRYTAKALEREDLVYVPYPVYDNGFCADLIKGFNYELYAKSWREWRDKVYRSVSYIPLNHELHVNLLNVNLAGEVVDKNTLAVYGTVEDTFEECLARRNEAYKDGYCAKSNCPFKSVCHAPLENASEHYCKCVEIQEGLC